MPIKNPELTPWPLKESRNAGDYKIFKVRSDLRTSPRTGKEHEFFVIESVDWCNIIALTSDDRLVMVEQYRQGTNLVELELPGGMIDPGEGPLETAARELREETGYAGDAPEGRRIRLCEPGDYEQQTAHRRHPQRRQAARYRIRRRRRFDHPTRAARRNPESGRQWHNRPLADGRRALPISDRKKHRLSAELVFLFF